MRIETERMKQREATAELIRELMADDTRRGNWLILMHDGDDEAFMQIAFDDHPDGVDLEYREGSGGSLYHCTRPVTRLEAGNALLDYFDGLESWKSRYTWEELKGYGGKSAMGRIKIVRDAEAHTVVISYSHLRPISFLVTVLFSSIIVWKTFFPSRHDILWNWRMENMNSFATWAHIIGFGAIISLLVIGTFLKQKLTIDAFGHCVYYAGIFCLGRRWRFDIDRDTQIECETYRQFKKGQLYRYRLKPQNRTIFGMIWDACDAEKLDNILRAEISRLG